MRLDISINRTSLPRSYFSRVGMRNSDIRTCALGLANWESLWFLGWWVSIEWGTRYDVLKPTRYICKGRKQRRV